MAIENVYCNQKFFEELMIRKVSHSSDTHLRPFLRQLNIVRSNEFPFIVERKYMLTGSLLHKN